jgi:phosphatidylinositol alpha-mannosyltransferase
MRVAILCPYSLSRRGGVQGQVVGLARQLGKLGLEATVLAPVDAPVEEEVLEGINLLDLGSTMTLRANGSRVPVAISPRASVRALRALKAEGDFDVVHLHEPLAPGPNYACLIRSHLPMVGTFHRSGSSIGYRLLGPGARWGASKLTLRCAVSPAARETAVESLGGTYEIIGNGVELDRFAKAEPTSTTGPTVLFVGRHEQRKGLEVLLEAFTKILESTNHTDVPDSTSSSVDRAIAASHPTLWIASDGPETARLKRKYPESQNISWLGTLEESELASRLAGAHILCAPSLRGESFGVILIEAMAARTAVVASDIFGYSTVAGDRGVLFDPGSVPSLVEALSGALRDVIAGNGQSSPKSLDQTFEYATQWSMAGVAEKYVRVYENAIRAKS